MLVVDGANVVGARPDGWWKDRAGAAARLHDALLARRRPARTRSCWCSRARPSRASGPAGPASLRVVHASKDGDSEIRRQALLASEAGHEVTVVTADRALAANVAPAQVCRPTWLLDRIG